MNSTQYQDLIKESLLSFVSENFMIDKDEIKHDKSLIDEAIIDSFGLIEITSFIEDEYKIEILEAHMTRDNFGSINNMVRFIESATQ